MSSTVTASARLFTEANSEYFSITNAAQTGLGLTTGAYIRGFVYLTETASTDGNNLRLVTKWNTTSDQRSYSVYIASSDNKLNFSVSSDGTAGTVVTVASTTALSSTATWYLFEAYYDGVNIGVSVNNETFVTSAFSAGIYNSTAIFAIGQDGNLGAGNLGGRACTISVYSADPGAAVRTALYNSGNGTLYQSLTAGQKTGLVSWWDGAETSGVLIDAHGTNHLTDNNTVTSAAGKVTYTAEDASQFVVANSEYLSVTSNSSLQTGDIAFSLAGWVYLDSLTNYRAIITKWVNDGNLEYSMTYAPAADNKFRLFVSADGVATVNVLSTLPAVATSNWYFVVAYHDPTANTIGISVNNGTVYTTSHSGGVRAGTAPVNIGRNPFGSTLGMDGRVACVGFWKKVLSASEITQLYNRGFGMDYSELDAGLLTSLISYWELTEASGTRVDSHGSNDLTDNNTVTGNPGVVYDVSTPPASTRNNMLLMGC